jgi:hypothetical protein
MLLGTPNLYMISLMNLHRLVRCNGNGRIYFNPLCEFINHDEDV